MRKIISLELFAGSRSFTKVAKSYGLLTYTTDYKDFNKIDQVCDIFQFDTQKAIESLGGVPDIVWASPPCTYFSVASIGHHWNQDHTPKTKEAMLGVSIIKKTLDIITYLKSQNNDLVYIIENPRGKLRKLDLIDSRLLHTVTYCQYGDSRMKPTDIWTNLAWTPRKMCKNGMPCHESAPRGSQTGTQGLKNDFERSKVPEQLCKEILNQFLQQ